MMSNQRGFILAFIRLCNAGDINLRLGCGTQDRVCNSSNCTCQSRA
jgi:hypothetical protein